MNDSRQRADAAEERLIARLLKQGGWKNRPTAKTAARKAFKYQFGATFIDDAAKASLWEAFQAGWRAARGRKPTTREGAT